MAGTARHMKLCKETKKNHMSILIIRFHIIFVQNQRENSHKIKQNSNWTESTRINYQRPWRIDYSTSSCHLWKNLKPPNKGCSNCFHFSSVNDVFMRSSSLIRSVRVAERLALPTLDHGVAGSNPAGGEILPEPKRRFIAQSLSCSPFHRLEMTEILLKGRKTLTHPSIHHLWFKRYCCNIVYNDVKCDSIACSLKLRHITENRYVKYPCTKFMEM